MLEYEYEHMLEKQKEIRNIRLLKRTPLQMDIDRYSEIANALTGEIRFEYCDGLPGVVGILIITEKYDELKKYVIDETGLLALTGYATIKTTNGMEDVYYIDFQWNNERIFVSNGLKAFSDEFLQKLDFPKPMRK